MFVDTNADQLFRQFHRSLVGLGRATLRLMRAQRLLQFITGPPGLPGQYRMDPTTYFPPHATDFLSTAPTTPPQSPARSHRNTRLSSSFSIANITTRERSRSRDRLTFTRPPPDDAAGLLLPTNNSSPPTTATEDHVSNHGPDLDQ